MEHFLSIFDLTKDEFLGLLERAAELKRLRRLGRLPKPLAGQNWALLFEKSSTRTRVSFEVGVNLLGGNAFYMSPDQIHLGRGEPLEDTARVPVALRGRARCPDFRPRPGDHPGQVGVPSRSSTGCPTCATPASSWPTC